MQRKLKTESGEMRCADGTRVAYQVRDSGAATARIAFIHSLAMDQQFWLPVAEMLPGDVSFLAWDCRGHGASDKPDGPYSVFRFAEDLYELLEHLNWPSATIVGASMGGCVAIAFAESWPGKSDSLGLVDTTAWYGPDAPEKWAQRADKALSNGLEGMVDFQATRWFSDRFRASRPEVVQKAIDVFIANDVKAYAAACRMLGACDLRTGLPSIRMPTMIAVGEEDYATPVYMAQALQAGIRGAELTVLENARHLTPLEAPDRIAEGLLDLLKKEKPQ